MAAQAQLSLHPVLMLPDAERAELARSLAAIVATRRSRKSGWQLLVERGLTSVALGTFYSHTRERGLEGALAAMLSPQNADAARALIADPPPAPARRVAVSTLANQFYCEMQVHLGTQHEVRVVSPELAAGTAGHATFEAEAEPITAEEIERRMSAGEAMGLVEMPLAAEVDGVEVIGRADRVQLEGTRAKLVLEFKFSGRREMYPSHVAQVEAYGTLLAARGIETDGLVHAVAVLPRSVAQREGLADTLARRALEVSASLPWRTRTIAPANTNALSAPDPMAGLAARRLDAPDYSLWIFPHEPAAAARDLSWAISYWKGAREPRPTDNPSKCRACPYNGAGLCSVARAAPDGRYRAKVIEGGRNGTLHLLVKQG